MPAPRGPLKQRAYHLLNRTAHDVSHHGISVAGRLVLGLLAMIIIGTIALLLPGVGAQGRLTLMEALFTSTSALTVTGLSLIVPSVELTLFGQVILLVLIQIGGVGVMFVAVIALQLIGRRIYIQDRLALTSSLGLDSTAEILNLFQRVLIGVLAIEGLGAFVLWLSWLRFFEPERALGYAIFHAISAFCNAGFDLFTGAASDGGVPFAEIPTDTLTLAIMGSLIFIGGLGIPVLSDLFAFPQRRRLSLHARLMLLVAFAITLVGWVGLYLAEATSSGVLSDFDLESRLVRTLFQSVSNRTAGFWGLPAFTEIEPASELLIMAMMFIGCAPASMGGGITTGTFAVLIVALWSYTRGRQTAQAWGRAIAKDTVRRAGAILTTALGLLAIMTWLVLITHDHLPLSVVLFEVVSAFATCGLSLGATSELNVFGKIIIMIMMFWGRLGPLTVVVALAQRRQASHLLVQYPEEQVLIG